MMKEIKATLYKIDGTKEQLILDNETNLETLQKLVGGLIEIIYIVPLIDELKGNFKNGKDLIINEEGKLLDLPTNPWSHFVGSNSIWENEIFHGDIVLIDGRLS